MSTAQAALVLQGQRSSGQTVRTQNVLAASSIANIVKSSLGPVGLDKMMVDDVGDVTITNDGATILQLLVVEHPAKVLVELAALQDEEVGDCTTSVVIIAAELLKNADELVKQKIHPTSIIAGHRQDLKKIAKATGASFVTSLANIEGEESFEASLLGEAEEVSHVRISDDELILVKGAKRTAASIILRGLSDMYTDEMERSIHDALCVIKQVLESKSVVVGGGCVKAALSIYLENFATSLSSREQLAIAEFAKSLLVIPKTLSVNAVKDSAKFRAYQNSSQTKKEHEQLKNFGLDQYEGVVRDNKKADVFEPGLNHDPQD